VDYLTRGLLMAMRHGDARQVVFGLTLNAGFEACRGPSAIPRWTALLRLAGELAEQVGDERGRLWQISTLGTTSLLAGDFATGLEFIDRAVPRFRALPGSTWELDTLSLFAGWALFWLGQLARMAERFALDHDEGRSRGDLLLQVSTGSCMGVIAALMRAAPDQARAHLAFAAESWSQRGHSQQHAYMLFGHAHVDLYEGRAEQAWQRARAEWPHLRSAFLFEIWFNQVVLHDVRGRAALAAALAAPDERARAQRLADAGRCARQLCREPGPWPGALGELLHAGVAHVNGALEKARAHAERARDLAAANGHALHEEIARLLLARLGPEESSRSVEDMTYAQREGISEPDRLTALFAPTLAWRGQDVESHRR
jgi:hypothetical protein